MKKNIPALSYAVREKEGEGYKVYRITANTDTGEILGETMIVSGLDNLNIAHQIADHMVEGRYSSASSLAQDNGGTLY